ncbi:apoptosis-antagonizing transcription factor [Blyttiomyces helicus]|uniref:Protein BFR2 n=1 Tax=Blyttiomyces helicus TaxID=388810 RepID=A0A4P9WKB3_9FUNG|nr:apoptosis-antagonizing transcription factor [Blyttiomyces helicus]|eukprot:RKO92008.1 apoptosis-antagonizing transcription factor [Blyttiomyces helicus]
MPPAKKKSLLEELAGFDNPAPEDIDPERAGDDGFGEQSDADSEDQGGREHYVDVGRSSIRGRLGVELDDPKYAGRRVSRQKLFEAENGLSGNDSEEDMEGLEDAEDDDDDDEDVDEESSEGEGDSDAGSDDDGESHYAPDKAQARIAKELAELAEEEKKLIKSMSVSAKADVEKGRHVRDQMALWDGLLDGRIRMQRAVAIANRFPQPQTYRAFVTATEDPEVIRSGIAEGSKELVALIDDLVDIRKALISANDAISMPAVKGAKKRKRNDADPSSLIDSIWSDLKALDEGFVPFRDQTIEKWNNKVQVAGGIPMQKKFKAINQSVLSQIKQVVSDKDRLIKRTQLNRADVRSLGQKTEKKPEDEADEKADADAHLANYDAEIFDDGDYYQQLLKDLIESRMADTDDPILLGMKWAQLKQLQQKQRKKKRVDTKASKGRKIRYHVHEKLQNFMAPEPRGTWHDEMTEELFRGLFGQIADTAKVEVKLVAGPGGALNSADGLKIFG